MLFGKKKPNEKIVLKELSKVRPPDMKQDIVALGLIRGLDVVGSEVKLVLNLPSTAAPLKDRLSAICWQNIQNIEGVESVQVEVEVQDSKSAPNQSAPHGQGATQSRVHLPGVKHMIAVASGKGGVGKSTVTVNLCVALQKMGKRVGLLDADIYGPSIPIMLGIEERPGQASGKIQPIIKYDLKVMSMGFLIDENQPVVWRGPMVHGALTQFMTQVNWGELDYLLIDMPPGTGDAQLTMSQTAPLSGAVIVTTPQSVSLADARKGLQMFRNVSIPVLGIVENMSGFCAPDGTVHHIFREGGGQVLAEEVDAPLLAQVPIEPKVAESGDSGTPLMIQEPSSRAAEAFQKAAQAMVSSLDSKAEFKSVELDW